MIPRTFRFDKYRFNPAKILEDVSVLGAPRQVEGGGHAELKPPLPTRDRAREQPDRDRYQGKEGMSVEVRPQSVQRRTLWKPLDDPSLLARPLKVMVGVDESESSFEALQAAALMAQKYHCRIIMIRVQNPKSSESEPAQDEAFFSKVKRRIEPMLDPNYLEHYPPKEMTVHEMDSALGLLKAATRETVSFLMVGSLPKTHSEIMRRGSVLTQLLQQAPCPVMVWRRRPEGQGLKKVLVPIDATPFSYQAIQQAIIICQEFGGTIYPYYVAKDQRDQEVQIRELNALMDRMEWHGVPHQLLTQSGAIVESIVGACKRHQIDFIVMGTHAVGPDGGRSLASKTLEVAHQVPCPLLVVHPHPNY